MTRARDLEEQIAWFEQWRSERVEQTFDFECLDCHQRGLDNHGRCKSCGSDAIATPNTTRSRERVYLAKENAQ